MYCEQISPIKIFVATQDDQMLCAKILEFSIRKHTNSRLEFVYLHQAGITCPEPKDPRNEQRTPFSFQRFLIPRLCGYSGPAIYLDSDMLVFTDIIEIWKTPFLGAELLCVADRGGSRKPQFSVMLLNCDTLHWDIGEIVDMLDSGKISYESLIFEMCIVDKLDARLPTEWNCLEYYEKDKTRLLHFTDMDVQPWTAIYNPLGYIWMSYLFEAIDEGFISIEFVKDQIKKEYVRPSLDYQVENRILDCLNIPKIAKLMDKEFEPPYRKLPSVPKGWCGSLYANAKFSIKKLFFKCKYIHSLLHS